MDNKEKANKPSETGSEKSVSKRTRATKFRKSDILAVDGKDASLVHRFCRKDKFHEGKDRRGWEVSHKGDGVKGEDSTGISEYGADKLGTTIERNELILCDASKEWAEDRKEFYNRKNKQGTKESKDAFVNGVNRMSGNRASKGGRPYISGFSETKLDKIKEKE